MNDFGHIPGVPVQSAFPSRKALAEAGVHLEIQRGIWKRKGESGARSVVVSGGYEDDEDFGDVIIYTGEGGRSPASGKQVSDQQLTQGNLALARNRFSGHPVRVTRGANLSSVFAPKVGYRYDGLFRVSDFWHRIGKSGHRVYLFRLERVEESPVDHASFTGGDSEGRGRRSSWVQRIVRDSAMALRVKELHDFRCQVCGLALETSAGPYAEAAHIRPLGKPHLGPDVEENCLCLCPNHHVQFDSGAISIHPDSLDVIGLPGGERLRVVAGHVPSRTHLAYHFLHYFEQQTT